VYVIPVGPKWEQLRSGSVDAAATSHTPAGIHVGIPFDERGLKGARGGRFIVVLVCHGGWRRHCTR
jgi:hypothetical protein